MPATIQCSACEMILLGFASLGPTPIGRDSCPGCGASEFEFVDG